MNGPPVEERSMAEKKEIRAFVKTKEGLKYETTVPNPPPQRLETTLLPDIPEHHGGKPQIITAYAGIFNFVEMRGRTAYYEEV